MPNSTRRIKIMLASLVGLFLLAGVARELMIRHVRSLGVDFPSDWSLVDRMILWQPPDDAVLEEAITDELARSLKWLPGFKKINTLSYQVVSPGFFRELGVQKKVTWVSIWSKVSNEHVPDLQIFPNVVHMELVDSALSF